ncbi:hypothetical protein BgiBS90_000255, partial [Biomphalaria glabrata]
KLTVINVQVEDNEDQLIGDHETQESEGGEADLHKYLVSCKKNPGHRQFIPVDTFTLKHLPEGHQDKDLYELIKAIADLTVRVDVKIISPHRPHFWPKTARPYPFSKMSDKRIFRTGSGRVWHVNKFQDGIKLNGNIVSEFQMCWYRKCQDSDTPNNVWWEFGVDTATHVVFDNTEANQTTLRLFFDRDDSPVANIDKVSVYHVNIEYDMCKLKCVTCDANLGNKLMEMWRQYYNIWEKVFDKYCDSRSKHKLNFIVSHPHGCCKQVSVGQWNKKHKVDDKTKFTYTTCTCPGSSGAHVYCVGYNEGMWWMYDLVHSGSLKSGINYSGTGYVY